MGSPNCHPLPASDPIRWHLATMMVSSVIGPHLMPEMAGALAKI